MHANSLALLVALLAIALTPHVTAVVYASPNSDEPQAEAVKNLTRSVYENDAQGVAKALSDGADPNSSYTVQFPLEVAAFKKNSEIVELLLKAGADPNLRKSYDPDESIFSGVFLHVPDFRIVELMINCSRTKLDGSALFLGRQVHFFSSSMTEPIC